MGLKNAGRPVLNTRMQISWGMEASSKRYAHVQIEDAASAMMLLEFRLTTEQVGELLGGTSLRNVEAEFTSYPERLGKQMEYMREEFPRARFASQPEADAESNRWAIANGLDYADARRNNEGNWVISGRRWVEINKEQP